MFEGIVLIPVIFVISIIVVSTGIKVIPMNKVFIIEKLGAYDKTLHAGIHFILPCVYRVANEVDLSERKYKTNEGTFRTYDDKSLTLIVNVSYQVIDPKLFNYAFDKDLYKVQEIVFDKLRHIILKNTVQDVKLDLINLEVQMLEEIAVAGNLWGLKIMGVNILL